MTGRTRVVAAIRASVHTSRLTRAAAAVAVLLPAAAGAQGSDPPQPDGYAYYWPGACVQAVQRSRAYIWRDGPDTAEYAPQRDTLPAEVRRVARDCAAQVRGHTAPHELIWLAQLQLAADDDAAAAAAVAQRLSQPDVLVFARSLARVLEQVIDAYLGASPGRLNAALPFLKKLDSLSGSGAAFSRVRAYANLMEYHRRLGHSVAAVRSAAEGVVRAGEALNGHDRIELASLILTAYRYVAEAVVEETGTSVAPLTIMAAARADIGKLPGASAEIGRLETVFRKYGTKAERVDADAWAGPAKDSVHPAPGRVTIINFYPSRLSVPALRRIARRNPDVDIVWVQPTSGYFHDLGPLTPQAETRELEKYLVQELGVPGSLAVVWPKFKHLPDGRREPELGATQRAYLSQWGVSTVLIDRAGVIRRMWLFWERSYEAQLARAVARYR